jgi:hypothetical protein
VCQTERLAHLRGVHERQDQFVPCVVGNPLSERKAVANHGAEKKTDHDVHIRLAEDRCNPEPLGLESDKFLIEELVSSLKAGKASGADGPDGLAPRFLKNLGRCPGALCWITSTSL